MLDASLTELTGLNDAAQAWVSLFEPGERIAIKVNCIRSSSYWTRPPLVFALVNRLQEIGVPAEQITIFDRLTSELELAGYPINRDGPGVRCFGTDSDYAAGWTIMDEEVKLSNILLSCDALINMPILKQHGTSGISFAMKNHYGTFDRPGRFHQPRIGRALAELNALDPIRERTRLIIGDALTIVGPNWYSGVPGDTILASFDPVAHDTLGLHIFDQTMHPDQPPSDTPAYHRASPWLENGSALGLGTSTLTDIDVVEVNLT
jgi:uncharacterized protein (DUF362 family)